MRPFALLFVLACGQAAYGQASILIETSDPGQGPRATEQSVLAVLERYLVDAQGVQRVRGLALDGKCVIRLDLDEQTNPQLARALVENRLRLAKPDLPPRCAMEILPASDSAFMLLAVQPADDSTWDTASIWVNVWVRPLLAAVPGVVRIHTIGAVGNQLQLVLDRDRLLAYNLAAGDVVAAVRDSRMNFDRLSMDAIKVTVKETMRDLGNIPIVAGKNIYLRDIAAVELVDETAQDARIFRRGGKDANLRRAVFVLVELAPGKASGTAMRDIQKVVARLRDILPKEMRVESRVLQAEDTTVVVHLPDDIGINGRREKAIAAAKAMTELSQIDTMFTIARLDTGKLIAYVFADDAKSAELHRSLRAKLAKVEGITARVGGLVSPIFSWPGQGAQFAIRVQGSDRKNLQKAAELLRTRLGKTPGLVDIDQFPKLRQELALEIDRERMGLAGVQPADLVNALAPRGQPIFGWPLPFIVAVPPPLMSKAPKEIIDEMGLLPVRTVARRPAVLLRDVAKIQVIAAPAAVLHEGRTQCIIVFGNVDGRTPEQAGADLRRLAQELAAKGVDVFVECFGANTTHQAPPQPVVGDKKEPPGRASKPTLVTTVTPKRITLTRRIEQPGEVMSLDSTPIYSKISGFAEKWRVDIGDYVKKDDLLVKLFIPEVAQELRVKEARVKQAEADLKLAKENALAAKAVEDAAKARIAQAEADVEQWSAEVSRAKELLKNAMNGQAAVDKCVSRWKLSKAVKDACDADWREKSALRLARQAGVEVAEAGIQVAKESYQQWKAWTAYAEIRAPYDGIITLRNVSIGDFVQPPASGSKNKAEPLFVLERYDIMRVVVQVPEMDARAVKKGDKAVFFAQALPGQDLSGTVTRQSFALDINSRTQRVECDLPNADQKLRPGMYVRAVIIGKFDNAWVLPAAAVMNDILADRDIRYCFQVVNGVTRRLNLEVGLLGDEGVEVLRKQEPGSKRWVNFSGQEAIVVTNAARLVDGQAVAPQPAEPKKKQ